jgi:hypothetical protein
MKRLLYLLLTLCWFLNSCGIIDEKDISKNKIMLYAPKNELRSKLYTINYWWEELPGASKYRLQIVLTDTSFRDSMGLVLDTLSTKTQFKKTMAPGCYLWSVTGVNGAYKTLRSDIWKLKVDSTSIAGQELTITTPGADTLYTKNPALSISWSELIGAKEYVVQLDTSGSIVLDKSVADLNYKYTFTANQVYTLGIYAKNGLQKSNTTRRTIIFDKTAPDTIRTMTPGTTTETGAPVISASSKLQWNAPNDNLSGIKDYTVKVTSSSLNINPVIVTVPEVNLSDFNLSNTSLTYAWSVVTSDKAGNLRESRRLYFKIK